MTDQHVEFYQVMFEVSDLGHVQSLKSLKKGLAFIAYQKGVPHIGTLDHTGKVLTYGYPDRLIGKQINCQPNIGETATSAYFVLHNQKVTSVMAMQIGQAPIEISDVATNMEITATTLLKKQMVLSLSNGYTSNIYQINGRQLVEQNIRYIDHADRVTQLNSALVYSAKENNHEYIYASDPLLPPKVENSNFTIFEFWPKGRVVGMVNAKSQNKKGRLRYSIISGNDGDVFRVDGSSGVLSVNNARNLKRGNKPSYTVRVQVTEKQKGSSIATVKFTVNEGRPFDHNNLRETLMFFPDFSRANTLTTTRLADGESVLLYDINFNMVDMLFIENGAIQLPAYPPGLYIINVRNKENLYQKIELQ
ncbi:MAG: hypothetical protein ACI9JN_002966 [Bacteroidia bacterium]